MNKASSEFEENLHRFQEAAKLFQGRVSLDGEILF